MVTSENKTILIVNDALLKGGAERRMLELIKGLIKNEYKIILVLLSDIVEYDYVYQLPIEFIILKRKFKFEYTTFNKLKNVIKKNRPAIIHSWGHVASIYLGPLAKIYNIKFVNGVITDAREGLSVWNSKYYAMSKISFPFSDVILSNSEAGIKAYKAPETKTFCIYNGIDINRFKQLKSPSVLAREIFGKEKPPGFVVGMVAAFEPRKDYMSLIKAAEELCNKFNDIFFLLIGDGNQFVSIKNMVDKKYAKQIYFLGKRNDIESILQLIDTGVLLTNTDIHGEGISNAIIEYMATAIPVVATRGGGTSEVVIDSVNGFLINPFDVKGFIEKVILLKSNSTLAKEMGKNGKLLIDEKFSFDVMMNGFINIYNTVLNKNK